MQLSKHHALGNDFLVLLDARCRWSVDGATARALCHRRRGVGADGLLRASAGTDGADVDMTLWNADGGLAEMSGNGIRCLGQAIARARGTNELDLVVGTAGGPRRLRVGAGPTPGAAWVEVDMGTADKGPAGSAPASAPVLEAATVDMGNPHLVLLVDDPAAVDLAALGPACQGEFEHGINVEVVAPRPGRADALDLRVWERGAGLTQACGTGACAAVFAAHGWGLVGARVRVTMPGGELDVALGDDGISLVGPAVHVADVEVPVPPLSGVGGAAWS
ncbi:MAG TPA: diaminopimelate epimerase [Acidimicrobiales bacterium]|nr:diaminopimelate epimerase [Acidimicrobiales bacterium]